MAWQIHWAWVILFASFATHFTNYSIRLGYGILMPEMIKSLGITKAQAGSIASSFYLTYTIFSPLLGFLVDRYSVRKLLVFFCLIFGSGTLLMSKPASLFQACLFFAIGGLGSSALYTSVTTLLQRWFAFKRRGMVLGILSTSSALGFGIMGLAIPFWIVHYDWRTCWLILASLAFALVPLNGLLLRTKPQDLNLGPWGDEPVLPAMTRQEGAKVGLGYREMLKLRNLWLGGISYFFVSFSAYIMITFIVTYGALELKLPYPEASRLASAFAFSGFFGTLFIPTLSDSLGRKRCLVLLCAFIASSILLIVWAGTSPAALFAAVCILGFFLQAAWPMFAAAARDFFPPEATGTVLGFWTTFYGLGAIMGPFLGGYIADLLGTFTRSFLLAAASAALGGLFFSLISAKKRSLDL
jgi:sugar phosphate permease